MLSPMRCTKALSMVKTCQLKPRRKFQPGRGALGPLPVTYSIDRGLQHQLPIYFAAIYRGYDSVEKSGRVLNTGILVTILNSYCFCNEEPGARCFTFFSTWMHWQQIPAKLAKKLLRQMAATKEVGIFTTGDVLTIAT